MNRRRRFIAVAGLILGSVLSGQAVADEPDGDCVIVVLKDRRLLRVVCENRVVREYPVGLGFEPVADKIREGDGATPEGIFHVCVKNPNSRFYLSLGLDYPAVDDAERGLEDGLITRAQHDTIIAAHEQGRCPPWDTRLGGEIFIHGRGAGSDWTLGCVALNDPDMRELFEAAEVGTRVEILP